jgi:AcrR family transcriptional regulator
MVKKAQPKPADKRKQIIEAALRLAAARGWSNLALADIAAAASLSLADLYAVFPSKAAILAGFMRDIDHQVLARMELPGEAESARDRLFDVLMKRFDALTPYRDGVAAIARDARRDPSLAIAGAWPLLGSMAVMLETAGIPSSGMAGLLRTEALSAIYLATLRDWLRDETTDKARTMAALDGRLRRAERWANWCARRRPA